MLNLGEATCTILDYITRMSYFDLKFISMNFKLNLKVSHRSTLDTGGWGQLRESTQLAYKSPNACILETTTSKIHIFPFRSLIGFKPSTMRQLAKKNLWTFFELDSQLNCVPDAHFKQLLTLIEKIHNSFNYFFWKLFNY